MPERETKRQKEHDVITRHNFLESNKNPLPFKEKKNGHDSISGATNTGHTNTKSTLSLQTREHNRRDSSEGTVKTNAVPSAGSTRPTLQPGLESSFASLRRCSATPDLLNTSNVFDSSVEFVRPVSSKAEDFKSNSARSTPRPKRPPTIESRSVSICETEVRETTSFDQCVCGCLDGHMT